MSSGKRTKRFALLLLVLVVSGCSTYHASVVSNQGKAYIIKTAGLEQEMLLCDASSGRPVCTTQAEN